jgi:ankyrin repeat protein
VTTQYYSASAPTSAEKDFIEGLEEIYGEALIVAASEGHLEICRLLIANGVYVNIVERDCSTSLQCAVKNRHT